MVSEHNQNAAQVKAQRFHRKESDARKQGQNSMAKWSSVWILLWIWSVGTGCVFRYRASFEAEVSLDRRRFLKAERDRQIVQAAPLKITRILREDLQWLQSRLLDYNLVLRGYFVVFTYRPAESALSQWGYASMVRAASMYLWIARQIRSFLTIHPPKTCEIQRLPSDVGSVLCVPKLGGSRTAPTSAVTHLANLVTHLPSKYLPSKHPATSAFRKAPSQGEVLCKSSSQDAVLRKPTPQETLCELHRSVGLLEKQAYKMLLMTLFVGFFYRHHLPKEPIHREKNNPWFQRAATLRTQLARELGFQKNQHKAILEEMRSSLRKSLRGGDPRGFQEVYEAFVRSSF